MKLYELGCLISPDLTEEDLKKITQKITESIKTVGGEIIQEVSPTKKRLGYQIKKQYIAYSFVLVFKLDSDKIEGFKNTLTSEPNILRSLVINKKIFKQRVIKERIKPIKEEGIEISKKIPEEKTKEEKKVEIEDIEKKLEELLGKI